MRIYEQPEWNDAQTVKIMFSFLFTIYLFFFHNADDDNIIHLNTICSRSCAAYLRLRSLGEAYVSRACLRATSKRLKRAQTNAFSVKRL